MEKSGEPNPASNHISEHNSGGQTGLALPIPTLSRLLTRLETDLPPLRPGQCPLRRAMLQVLVLPMILDGARLSTEEPTVNLSGIRLRTNPRT